MSTVCKEIIEDWQNLMSSTVERSEYLLASGYENHSFHVFGAMFYGKLAEDTKNRIEIKEIDAEVFDKLVRFAYSNSVEISSLEEAISLYYAADKYMFELLKRHCIAFTLEATNTKNVCEVLKFAKLMDIYSLQDVCLEVFRSKTSEIITSGDFYNLDMDSLSEMLSQCPLNATELQLFNALENFAQLNNISYNAIEENKSLVNSFDIQLDNNDEDALQLQKSSETDSKKNSTLAEAYNETIKFSKIIRKIRFLVKSAQEFSSGPAFSKWLSESDALSIFACIADPKNIPKKFPFGYTNSTKSRQTGYRH